MAGSKNNISNRGKNTHNPDRTLCITFGPGGKIVSKRFEIIEGIAARLSKVPSAGGSKR